MGRESGSTLVEVLIAALVVASGVSAMAHLIGVAIAANRVSRDATVAAILAAQKVEQLRALAWGFDVNGVLIGDATSDTTRVESPGGGTGLQPSPSTSLERDTPGYVDFIDATGQAVQGAGAQPPPQAVFTRRWSIQPSPISPDLLMLDVLVTPRSRRGAPGSAGGQPGDARITTGKARKRP